MSQNHLAFGPRGSWRSGSNGRFTMRLGLFQCPPNRSMVSSPNDLPTHSPTTLDQTLVFPRVLFLSQSHRIHVWYIYICYKSQRNIGKSPIVVFVLLQHLGLMSLLPTNFWKCLPYTFTCRHRGWDFFISPEDLEVFCGDGMGRWYHLKGWFLCWRRHPLSKKNNFRG